MKRSNQEESSNASTLSSYRTVSLSSIPSVSSSSSFSSSSWLCWKRPRYSYCVVIDPNTCNLDPQKKLAAIEVKDPRQQGLSIEDDENDQIDTTTASASASATALSHPRFSSSTTNSIGLVFEEGTRHVDRRLHKERPSRISAIHRSLQQAGLLSRCQVLGNEEELPSIHDLLQDVHLPAYLKRLEKLQNCTCQDTLQQEALQYTSVYLTQDSFREAKRAARTLCHLVQQVLQGRIQHGFAMIRPPGHHAEPGMAGGYCLLNNIAVAAKFAHNTLDKVLIVDWDVHHGNGTQSIFQKDPNVLYISMHRHSPTFYPYHSAGGPKFVGVGNGKGYNANIGWTRPDMGNDEYLAAFQHVVLPMAQEFQPQLVLISAGFDAAHGDAFQCHVTPDGFAQMTYMLKQSLPNIGIVAALEGGYVPSVLGECVNRVVETLLEEEEDKEEHDLSPPPFISLDDICPTAAKNIRATLEAHAPYWTFLQTQHSIS